MHISYLAKTSSTNKYLLDLLRQTELAEGYCIYTGYQTSGKGQAGNSWESENLKNLLFSIVLYPKQIEITEHFILSQIISVAIVEVLTEIAEGFSIKWPNDIYYGDRKIAGILIENSIQGNRINQSVIGIGLNVNQTIFRSDAPNPISLIQITHEKISRKELLLKIYKRIMTLYTHFDTDYIRKNYVEKLYRSEGFHRFEAMGQIFEARIHSIKSDGQLQLENTNGEILCYYFKEVSFCL